MSGDVTGNILKVSKTDSLATEIDGISIRRETPKPSGAKSLLTWDSNRKKVSQGNRNLSPPPNQENNSTTKSANSQEEAGRYLIKGYHWSDTKSKQYAGTCPYGISEPYESYNGEEEKKKRQASGTPQSLGSLLNKK